MHCSVVDRERGTSPLEGVDSIDASHSFSSSVASTLTAVDDR